MISDINQQAFLALVKGGLWETDVRLANFGKLNYSVIYRLAEEQAVIGLVAAGIEHVVDVKIPQDVLFAFVGATLQYEKKNTVLNALVAKTYKLLRLNDIQATLVKGQGIAQCYQRPLWRASGDIDYLLDLDDYEKARLLFINTASNVENEVKDRKHQAFIINGNEIELHGTLHSEIGNRVDRVIDSIQSEVFKNGQFRYWKNEREEVALPSCDNDVIFVFVHILQHFFRGGIGIRQICDWCRILWTFKEEINIELLESRIRTMNLMTEWKVFSSLAVDYLGMPTNAIPLYNQNNHWSKKAKSVITLVLEVGNFGHNRDSLYLNVKPFLTRKAITFYRLSIDGLRHITIFPKDAIRVWFRMLYYGFTRRNK